MIHTMEQGHLLNTKECIIIGCGGHAAEIMEYIRYSNGVNKSCIHVVGMLDDDSTMYDQYSYEPPYLGGIREHDVRKDIQYVLGIAHPTHRSSIAAHFKAAGANFLTIIHPSAYLALNAVVGEGSVIAPNVTLGPNVRVGCFNLINARASIGHDSIIGDYNVISPNVCFSGHTHVGNENMFGMNSATLPGVSVQNRNMIMAGMILDKNTGSDETVFYRFKEKISIIIKRETK